MTGLYIALTLWAVCVVGFLWKGVNELRYSRLTGLGGRAGYAEAVLWLILGLAQAGILAQGVYQLLTEGLPADYRSVGILAFGNLIIWVVFAVFVAVASQVKLATARRQAIHALTSMKETNHAASNLKRELETPNG